MKKALLFILLATFILSGCSNKETVAKRPQRQPLPLTIVAKVNDVSISKKSFDKKMKAARDNSLKSGQMPDPENILEVLIDEELIAQAAVKKSKLSSEEKAAQKYALGQQMKRSLIEKIKKKATVTSKEVVDYLGDKKSPNEIHLLQIVLNEEKSAQEVANSLLRGGDFDALAKEYSIDQQYDLGVVKRGELDSAVEAAAFQLKPGEISQVVSTGFGYYIVKRVPLSEEFIMEKLRNAKEEKIWQEQMNKLRNKAEIVINQNFFG